MVICRESALETIARTHIRRRDRGGLPPVERPRRRKGRKTRSAARREARTTVVSRTERERRQRKPQRGSDECPREIRAVAQQGSGWRRKAHRARPHTMRYATRGRASRRRRDAYL